MIQNISWLFCLW